jgi:hypothetical protein
MKHGSLTVCAAALCVFSTATLAGEHMGDKDILCAVTNTVSCDPVGDCIKGPATVHNLPVFLRFQPGKKLIEEAKAGGERRSSKIASVGGDDETLVMLGADVKSGWSATINKATGSLTATVSVDGEGYLIFGSCLTK